MTKNRSKEDIQQLHKQGFFLLEKIEFKKQI